MKDKNIDTLVMAVGGEGRRLAEYFRDINFKNTKTLLPIKGQPFLKYMIDAALFCGYKKIFLLASFYEDNVQSFVDNFYKDKNVMVVRGGAAGRRGGVARVLSKIEKKLVSPFVYSDGDIFFERNLFKDLSKRAGTDKSIIKCVVSSKDSFRLQE